MRDEIFMKNILREEVFVDEYQGCAYAASQLLNDERVPNPSCSDQVRNNIKYSEKEGLLDCLTFHSAAIYHKAKKFSSTQIILRSSTRSVTIRVSSQNDELVASKIIDKARAIA